VVTNGAYTIDAAAQLSGKTSMMNPDGDAAGPLQGMDMSEMRNNTMNHQQYQTIK